MTGNTTTAPSAGIWQNTLSAGLVVVKVAGILTKMRRWNTTPTSSTFVTSVREQATTGCATTALPNQPTHPFRHRLSLGEALEGDQALILVFSAGILTRAAAEPHRFREFIQRRSPDKLLTTPADHGNSMSVGPLHGCPNRRPIKKSPIFQRLLVVGSLLPSRSDYLFQGAGDRD